MLDRAGLDRLDHFVGHGEHRVVREAGHQRRALSVILPAAEADGVIDQGREILVAVGIRRNVRDTGPADLGCGVEVAGVGGLGRHQAVGGVEHDAGQVVELLLLVLPGGAEVALELRELLELRVGVRRQHLAVRVDVDALARALFQQHLEVAQVVAGDHHEGALVMAGLNLGRHRIAVRAGVGRVEQLHTGEVDGAELHNQAEPLSDAVVVAERLHALLEPGGDGRVGLAEHAGVGGIGGHAAQAEEQCGAQRDDVRVAVEEVLRCEGCRAARYGDRRADAVAHGRQGGRVEVHVGDGHEERIHKERLACRAGGLAVQGTRQSHEPGRDLILQVGGFGVFAADAHAGTALAARGLLALETEHVAHEVLLIVAWCVMPRPGWLQFEISSRRGGF